MSLVNAFATLGTLEVTGITTNYEFADIKRGAASTPTLPCLLPYVGKGESRLKTHGEGVNSYMTTHEIRHRLLYHTLAKVDQATAQANMAEIIDNYIAKVGGIILSSTSNLLLVYQSYEAGVLVYNGVEYWGVDFYWKPQTKNK